MVNYQCHKCKSIFNRKANYERHSNKKYNCMQNNNDIRTISEPFQNFPILSKIFQNFPNNEKCDSKSNIEKIDNEFYCGYCLKCYSTKGNLIKHLKICKIKKQQDDEKENIFKLLLEKDDIIKQKDDKINKILEQNQILVKELIDLKNITIKHINKSNKNTNITTNNINSNNIQNNTQNNIVMVNFGKEDLSIIDRQIYIDRVVKKHIFGVKIPEEILKIIYFNPQYPQLSNIYISDINREKCMVYEDGEWKLSPVDKIPEVIDKVVEYSNEIENELREEFSNNKILNERLNVVGKYVKMNDSEYVEELKEDVETNKNLITRCENFQKMTYDTIKTTLYNEGKNIKKQKNN